MVTLDSPEIEKEEVLIKADIEYINVQSLKYYPDNPRNHSDAQIDKLASQIKKVGFNQPIIIDEKNQVLVGNGRLEAADKLNMEKVPCIRYKNLSSSQKKQLIVADNKLNDLSDWNTEILGDWLNEINNDNLESFFSTSEMTEIWESNPNNQKEIVQDEVPVDAYTRAKNKSTVKTGDIYQLGNHRLMCGDSTKKEDIQKLMDGQMADMILTDPPWNVNYGQNHPSWKKREQIQNDNLGDNFSEFIHDSFNSLKESIKDGCMTYVVMSAQEWGTIMNVLKKLEFHWSSTVIWKKDHQVLSRKDYHTQYEPIYYGWYKDGRLCPLKDRKQSDVWDIKRPIKSEEHPTMKPIELCARAIKNSSREKNIIIDHFGGSGSTLIACEQLERNCYMMEMDPAYCQVIIDRWEKFTGNKAQLIKQGGNQ